MESTEKGDPRFFWNRNLSFPLERYGIDTRQWIVHCICGSVIVRTIYLGHRTAKVAIISRLSCEYMGTRFNVRGINDDGNVANFIETEQLIIFEEQECSFLQLRGSIPLFWEQPGINVGSHAIKLGPLELSLKALERHYIQLKKYYGRVLTINLLGSKKGEATLSTAFQTALNSLANMDVKLISFNYHAEMKQSKENVKRLLREIASYIDEYSFFHNDEQSVLSRQNGLIRTNCLDCLDRTNCIQTLIGMRALVNQLNHLGVEKFKANSINRFEEVIKEMWQKNGDQCSIIYAGTGALEGKSKLKDASRSIVRTIQNNLMDMAKQDSFDLLLYGKHFGSHQFIKLANVLPSNLLKVSSYFFECANLEAFIEREDEMCSKVPLKIFAGTWNVNGGKNMYNVAFREEHSLATWLFPTDMLDIDTLNYDVIAVGFEEIVDLNASNLVKASTTNQRIWRDGLKRTIDEFQKTYFPSRDDSYAILCCEQLVGVSLILFVRLSLVNSVRDLAISEIKTGMGGTTGNKGSLAVRLTINSTSICFVCSHFAAGQNEVVARNSDFLAALKRIRFPMGRTIPQHDAVFWIGDFNYRISLPGDEVKNAVQNNKFAYLSEYDQLSQQREQGNVFTNFKEGPLHFAPTYKYDTFSDDYDTSEKCRSPAWTDRILWMDQSNLVRLIHYGRSELKTSDHRPVFAIFQVDTHKFDFELAAPILKDIIYSIGPPNCNIVCSVTGHANFPQELCNEIFSKIYEFGSTILLSKLQRELLYIIFSSGTDALAALSMDGLILSNGQQLNVKLASTPGEWPESDLNDVDRALEQAKMEDRLVQSRALQMGGLSTINLAVEDSDDEEATANGNMRSKNSTPIPPDQALADEFKLIDISDIVPNH